MRVHGIDVQVRAGEQLGQRRPQVVVAEAETVHAGVDLEVIRDSSPVPGRRVLNGAGRRRRRNGGREGVLEQSIEVAYAQRAEDKDWHADAGATQDDALFDIGARQHPRAGLFERERHASGAMAVGVGLDDRDDAGRLATAHRLLPVDLGGEVLLNRAEVGLKRSEIDVGYGAADHVRFMVRDS